jgi:SseB protein N-terminal domain
MGRCSSRYAAALATVGCVFSDSSAQRFGGDDGSADLAVAAALQAYATAQGSEHAVLTALAAVRLLVPVVATLTPEDPAAVSSDPADACHAAGAAGEKSSEMAMATLIGRDGRRAVPAFTSLETLARWQPSARPIPVTAAQVWQAAAEDSCAVVIDVAGPVPLAVEGARLAALAGGAAVPPPQEDPDIHAAIAAILAATPLPVPPPQPPVPAASPGPAPAVGQGPGPAVPGFTLHPADADGDLLIELTLPPATDRATAEAYAARLGSAVMDQLASRLRRGIAIALAQ